MKLITNTKKSHTNTHSCKQYNAQTLLFLSNLWLKQVKDGSHCLPIATLRASGTSVWTPSPPLLTCPPTSPATHGHLQKPHCSR